MACCHRTGKPVVGRHRRKRGAGPGSLYRFFADEVFAALDAETQQGLTTLALAPVLDEGLARALLGSSADLICSAAVASAFWSDASIDWICIRSHACFLRSATAQLGLTPAEGAAETCLDTYRDRHTSGTPLSI